MASALTIDNLDDATAEWLRREARRRGVGEQAVALYLIRQAITSMEEKTNLRTYHDLDALAGTWSQEEAEEFAEAIRDFSKVDESLWK